MRSVSDVVDALTIQIGELVRHNESLTSQLNSARAALSGIGVRYEDKMGRLCATPFDCEDSQPQAIHCGGMVYLPSQSSR